MSHPFSALPRGRPRERSRRCDWCEGRSVVVRVPATSANLGPGFDTLGLALSVYDELIVTALPQGELEIDVSGEGADDVPRDASNLVVRSIAYAFEAVGRRMPGLRLRRATSSRTGGASGRPVRPSSRACSRRRDCWQGDVEFGTDTLLRLATELEGHPDNVAPALFGGLTIAWIDETGRSTRSSSCIAASRRWCSCPSSRCRRSSRAACSRCRCRVRTPSSTSRGRLCSSRR